MNTKIEKYDLIFITTFVEKDYIEDLVNSIIKSNQQNISVLLIIICQNGSSITEEQINNVTIKTLKTSSIISLSKARNIGINYILNNNIKSTYVMFPDDDSSFDSTFFYNYEQIDKTYNYIIDVYCTNTKKLFINSNLDDTIILDSSNWKAVCSVNMMITFQTLRSIGLFDENLGVGTFYGAGEDNDYFIRICKTCDKFRYIRELYNFHPSPKNTYETLTFKQLVKRFNSYGRGVIYCLCKHSRYYDASIICLRAIGGCLVSIVKGNIKLAIAYIFSFISRLKLFCSLLFCKHIIKWPLKHSLSPIIIYFFCG